MSYEHQSFNLNAQIPSLSYFLCCKKGQFKAKNNLANKKKAKNNDTKVTNKKSLPKQYISRDKPLHFSALFLLLLAWHLGPIKFSLTILINQDEVKNLIHISKNK